MLDEQRLGRLADDHRSPGIGAKIEAAEPEQHPRCVVGAVVSGISSPGELMDRVRVLAKEGLRPAVLTHRWFARPGRAS